MKLNKDNGDDNEPVPLTPDLENCQYRFADGVHDSTNDLLYVIREDHVDKPLSKDVVNEIVTVSTSTIDDEEEYHIQVVATGNDFYAAPRLSPDGTKLAYITWNHPNMPWDATELRVRSIVANNDEESASSSSHELIAGSDGDTSIIQPLWHPITGDLYYISDESGYYNIYRYANDGNGEKSVSAVLPMSSDFGGAAPGWSLGQQGFSFLSDGRLVAQYKKNGESRLLVVDVLKDDGSATPTVEEFGTEHGLPLQFGSVMGGTTTETAQDLYFIGGSPSTPTSIYKWNLQSQGEAIQLVCSSTLQFEDTMISIPKSVEFPTSNDKTAFGYYYAPNNGNFQYTKEGVSPPLLVKAHGGPTACTGTSFNAGIQYWTSRGFAVLDVDYGGSTGYGRDYRRRLRQSWGVVDIDDVCAGATYLVEQGLVDGERLCIDGGSAGGYTTLGALAFRPEVFKAGCSLYGIGDLTALAGDTHKFESRYLDGLVGPYPEEEELYKKRSPIESVDTLNCPILLLQGAEDKVVPPNQAEMMHKALVDKKIPTCLKIYDNEQHGFRNAVNIENAIDSELAFYGRVFDINVPGALKLDIDNLP